MKNIKIVSKQILKSCFRAKSFSLVAFFLLALMGFSYLLAGSDSAFKPKLLLDSGLSLVKVFGLILVAFIIVPIYKIERDRRTLAASLSFSVSRNEYIWGIWLGAIATLLVNYCLMGIIFFVFMKFLSVNITVYIARQLFLTFLELIVMTSIAIMFSVFFSLVVATMLTGTLFVIGNMTFMAQQSLVGWKGSFIHFFLEKIMTFVPNLSLYNLKDLVLKSHPVPVSYDLITILYTATIVVITMELASWKFSKESLL